MSIERFPIKIPSHSYHIYALLCQDQSGDSGYVKFGYSRDVLSRLTTLRVNCPIPVKMIAVVNCGTDKRSVLTLERAIHERFDERRATGEWFRFDFSKSGDKQEFNSGCKEVFSFHSSTLRDKWWRKIPISAIETHQKRATAKFLSSNNKYRSKINRDIKRHRAWKELDEFRIG